MTDIYSITINSKKSRDGSSISYSAEVYVNFIMSFPIPGPLSLLPHSIEKMLETKEENHKQLSWKYDKEKDTFLIKNNSSSTLFHLEFNFTKNKGYLDLLFRAARFDATGTINPSFPHNPELNTTYNMLTI